MTTEEKRELEQRIRANSNPISGLSKTQYEQHVQGIVRVVERAKERP
jgi:hypothetical protein